MTEADTDNPKGLRVSAAASYLGVSPEQLRKMSDLGIIPTIRTLGGEKQKGHRMWNTRDLDFARMLLHQGKNYEQIKAAFAERNERRVANG